MDQMVKVSVIMLTYNREELVGRAIESILAQTMQDFEYIIVDNGSTDRSGAIAEEYAKKDARIRVLRIPKSNIGTGRNAGLDVAKGEYITFIDDDDTAEPDMLEFLYGLAKDAEADISICGTDLKSYDERYIWNSLEAMKKLLERKCFNSGFPTKLIRSRLYDNNRFLETSRYDDIYLMPKIIAAANKIAYYGKAKYLVNRHEGNNSAWTTNHKLLTPEILSEYLQVYRERTEWLQEVFPENTQTWRYFEWSFMLSMVEKITRLALLNCYTIRDRLREELRNNIDEFLRCTELCEFEKEWIGVLL